MRCDVASQNSLLAESGTVELCRGLLSRRLIEMKAAYLLYDQPHMLQEHGNAPIIKAVSKNVTLTAH